MLMLGIQRILEMNSSARYAPIDLNDYLDYLPRHQKGGYRECPVCNGKLSFSRGNGEKFTCYGGGCSHSDIRKAILDLAGGNTQSEEWEAARATREHEKVENERIRIANLRSEVDKNADWQKIIGSSSLSDRHREAMLEREWKPEWIESSKAFSSARGRVIPIATAEGLTVGAQVITTEGKIWYGSTGTNQVKETGELPLVVVYPESPRFEVKNGVKVGYIAYTESVCDKPWLCAQIHDLITIGSSNIGSQPKDLARSIATIKAKYGFDEILHILMADGGAIVNKGVMSSYTKLSEQLPDLHVGWWEQKTKADGDIDEIPATTKIQILPFSKFLTISKAAIRKAAERATYDRLSSLSVQISEQRDEAKLSPLPMPRGGHFTFVDSSVATGKTKQLARLKSDWRRVFPEGKILSLGYRNGLLRQQGERLGIPHIEQMRVGFGQSSGYINSVPELALCLDSLLEIKIDDIPPNTLIIHDEVEAILSHAAQGGTLGGRIAQVQAHLVAIYHHVLSSGGAVIGLEDSITDVSVKGLQSLTDNRYPFEIISNSAVRFEWECAIGNGKKAEFVALLLARLKAGERIVLTTSSQKFGEMLERLVLASIPEMDGFIERIDSSVIADLRNSELLTKPSEYIRSKGIKLLILSPTVESGFSIEDGEGEPLFNRMMAYFVNLDTRSQNQLLSRYRSNCPRDIYALERGAEAGRLISRDPEKLLKIQTQTANATSLEQGNGRINNSIVGEVWNRLAAEFACRSAISSQYMREYLELELIDRGHSVTKADWSQMGEDEGLILTDPVDLKGKIADILAQMEREKAEKLVAAKTILGENGKPDVKKATAILHSSSSSNDDRLRAEKTILADELPGADLTFEFVLEAVVKRRGAYRRECELSFFIGKSELAKLRDKKLLESQIDKPHIIYSRVPKLSQRIALLDPIANFITDLTGREYSEDDEIVVKMNDYLLSKSYDVYRLFGLHIKAELIDSKGRRQNTRIANVNKVLKKMGWESGEVKQLGARGDRTSIYKISNLDCPHRQTIYTALELKCRDLELLVQTDFDKDNSYIKTVCTDSKSDEFPPHPFSGQKGEPDVGGRWRVGDKVIICGEVVTIERILDNFIGARAADGSYVGADISQVVSINEVAA
jgi:hypothetical protein